MMLNQLIDTYRHRNLIKYLIVREIKVSHRDKLLGNLWSLLDPLMMMLVLYLVFSTLRHAQPVYCLYLLTGLIGWDIFSKSLNGCALCIKRYRGYILKFPLPMVIFPTAVVLHKLYDLAWGMFAYVLIYFGIKYLFAPNLAVPWQMVWFPVWTVGYFALCLGLGFIIARIGVFFEDIRDVLNILLRLGFFINPVFIDMGMIPAKFHPAFFVLNPVAGYLMYFRHVVPGGTALINDYVIPVAHYPVWLTAWTVALFFFGLWLYNRGSAHFAKYL